MSASDSQLEGRVCRRLRAMLEELGLTDINLWPQKGAWRTDVRLDVYRWEGHCTMPPDANGYRAKKALCSWDTMTACVRAKAILVEPDDLSLMVSPTPGRASELKLDKVVRFHTTRPSP